MNTATRPPREEVARRVLGTLAWLCQAGMATTYAAVITRPDAWHTMYATDPVQTVLLWCLAAGMALVWAGSLWQEQSSFYHRGTQDLFRKLGLFAHLSILLVACVAAIPQDERASIWGALPVMSFFVITVWVLWMRALSLPPEDQAVIDALHNREAHQAAEAYDASQKERRRERLSAIVAGLGYQLTDVQTPTPQTDANDVRWAVPARKHAPLVYFIRNGNRLKIGTTTELKRRIRTLALRAENVVLLLDGGKPLESSLHKQFADLRIGNTEWFAYDGDLIDFISDQNRLARKEEAK